MKYLLMVVLLFSFEQSNAVNVTSYVFGNELLDFCGAGINKTNALKGNMCNGYIMGIVDSHAVLSAWDGTEMRFCLPESLVISQLVRIVTKHLQENPGKLHLSAGSLVSNALSLAFPCE